MIGDAIRVSMPLAELVIIIGAAFSAGFFLALSEGVLA